MLMGALKISVMQVQKLSKSIVTFAQKRRSLMTAFFIFYIKVTRYTSHYVLFTLCSYLFNWLLFHPL